MVSFKNVSTLVVSKMRTRRRQTVISVVVAGVLFGFLLAAAIMWKSLAQSVADFSDSVTAGKQLVLASKIDNSDNQFALDQGLIQQAKLAFRIYINERKGYAASIGYIYDETKEIPVILTDTDAQGHANERLNLASPIAQRLLETARKDAKLGLPEINTLTQGYGTKNIFEVRGMSVVDGKLESDTAHHINTAAILSPQGQSPYILDQSVLTPYIFKTGDDHSVIPIIIPFSAAEVELGLTPLPSGASTQDRLSRLQKVKDEIGKISFKLCYRNNIELQQIAQAKSQENGTITYAEPETFCGAVKTVKDNRTAEQKAQDDKQRIFDAHFGIDDTPQHQLIAYQAVGIVPDSQVGSPKNNLSRLVFSFLSPPGFGFSAITDQAYMAEVDKDATLRGVFTATGSTADVVNMRNYVIEFPNKNEATRFLDSHMCEPGRDCTSGYTFTQFGSNSIQLASMTQNLQSVFMYAAGAIALAAVIILGGTFSKLVADSRKETAVFRAFGAKRLDIYVIYLAYSLILAIFTFIFAVGLAYSIAWVFHLLLTGQLQSELQLTYGFANGVNVSLIGPAPIEVISTAILIVISGLLGMLLSLIGNIKRDVAPELKEI